MAENVEFHLHIQGPQLTRDFTIPTGETLVGREAGSGLQLAFPQVSRQHARFICTPTQCQIIDLGSANGTTVNGQKLIKDVPVILANGAIIQMGPCTLVFEQVQVKLPIEEVSPVDLSPILVGEEKPTNHPAGELDRVPSGEWGGQWLQEALQEAPQGRPPAPPDLPPSTGLEQARPPGESGPVPPGLSTESIRLINFLPDIYHTQFMKRFLALFESILVPIEWTVDNFDLFLDPGTAPNAFLPWLANWYAIVFNPSWDEVQRRAFLKDAHLIYARRGTRWALARVLEIYTGKMPTIIEFAEGQDPHTFTIKLPLMPSQVDRELVERLIDMNKPAHTSYVLELPK